MRSTRVFSLATVAALALAVTGCGGNSLKKDEPQTAARDFLSEALSQKNGQRACDFMTQDAQQALIEGKGVEANCREALERSSLLVDGEQVNDVSMVNDLDFDVAENDGETAKVIVTGEGGAKLELTLAKSEGLGNLYEPETPWRITGGAEPLLVGAAS